MCLTLVQGVETHHSWDGDIDAGSGGACEGIINKWHGVVSWWAGKAQESLQDQLDDAR